RHRTPTWLWVAITLAALALLIVLSVFGWLNEYGDAPMRLVVDGTEYGFFDPSTLSVPEKLGVAFGVMLALVVAAIVVPVALVIALVVARAPGGGVARARDRRRGEERAGSGGADAAAPARPRVPRHPHARHDRRRCGAPDRPAADR